MNDTLKAAGVFSDHAVLQRDAPLPVWGWAAPGARVEVELAGARASATADTDGKWSVVLPPLQAGGPHAMTLRSGNQTVVLRDLLLGEVWVCSGQSNMEWPVSLSNDAEAETRDAANWPALRLLQVPKVGAVAPVANLADAAWQPCSPDAAAPFSAVAYSFGRQLVRALDVPVGLINTSWGGTVAETWASLESLQADPDLCPPPPPASLSPEEAAAARRAYEALVRDYENRTLRCANLGWPGGWGAPGPLGPEWRPMELPRYWQDAGYLFSGVFWFRREIDVPAAWAGKPLTLAIGACDKSDVTYFNNVEVGSIRLEERGDAWCVPRAYTVPGELVKAGPNTIAVRVTSHMYGGGMTGPAQDMRLSPAGGNGGESLPLAGTWHYRIEQDFWGMAPPPPPPQPGEVNTPCALFNGMIAPLLPYAIRGAIWYQGESNVGRAEQYRKLLPAMIGGWRRAWGQGDFPFYIVQLANYNEPPPVPAESLWAELREAQTAAAQGVANAGLAVIIDIGDTSDIHPRNKQEVGRRLALLALDGAYRRPNLTVSGPTLREMSVSGGSVRLRFAHADRGLVLRGAPDRTGFLLAGEDRRFAEAAARIEGADTVVLTSAGVPQPVAVRYAWAGDPPVSLFNGAGLPASPFRTDRWPRARNS